MRRRHSSLFTVVATTLTVAACGASVPTTPEATAVLSTAIASTLTRTLPAATYCMTANPDFSFANLGQVDFVEMLQNVRDKEPLFDAAIAGVVRVELREFPFNPAGRSPDPSCDAVHAQSRQSGHTSGQVRLAMVRTTLTPKGTAAGIQFDAPIDVATREVAGVTDIRTERGGVVAVTYTWQWTPTTMAEVLGYKPAAPQEATARLRRTDDGWVVEDAGVK